MLRPTVLLWAAILIVVLAAIARIDPIADYLRIRLGPDIRWFWWIGLILFCIIAMVWFRKRKGP